jgi:hypothetical protein
VEAFGNIPADGVENATFLIYLTEYHSGFRAYTRRYLEAVNVEANSDGFVFDTEIIAQGMAKGLRITEIPIATRYFDEASQIAFGPSVRYGLAILKTMILFKLHAGGSTPARSSETGLTPRNSYRSVLRQRGGAARRPARSCASRSAIRTRSGSRWGCVEAGWDLGADPPGAEQRGVEASRRPRRHTRPGSGRSRAPAGAEGRAVEVERPRGCPVTR